MPAGAPVRLLYGFGWGRFGQAVSGISPRSTRLGPDQSQRRTPLPVAGALGPGALCGRSAAAVRRSAGLGLPQLACRYSGLYSLRSGGLSNGRRGRCGSLVTGANEYLIYVEVVYTVSVLSAAGVFGRRYHGLSFVFVVFFVAVGMGVVGGVAFWPPLALSHANSVSSAHTFTSIVPQLSFSPRHFPLVFRFHWNGHDGEPMQGISGCLMSSHSACNRALGARLTTEWGSPQRTAAESFDRGIVVSLKVIGALPGGEGGVHRVRRPIRPLGLLHLPKRSVSQSVCCVVRGKAAVAVSFGDVFNSRPSTRAVRMLHYLTAQTVERFRANFYF